MAAAGLAVGAVTVAVPATGTGAVAFLQNDQKGAWVLNPNRTQAQLNAILNRVKATRTKGERANVFWASIAPTKPKNPRNHMDPAYNWAQYDAIFRGLRQRGIKPDAAVFDYPRWTNGKQPPLLQGGGARSPYNPFAPRKAKDFENFMFAFSRRYNGKGGRPAVRMIETCNEANLKAFFRKGARSRIGAFAALHRAAWKGIRAGNPAAKVILCPFGPNSSGRNGNVKARSWLKGLTRAKNMNWHAVAVHIYPPVGPKKPNPRKVFPRWDSIAEIQKIIQNSRGPKRNKNAKILVTEAGYTTARTPFRKTRVTPRQQKLFLKQIFALPLVKKTKGPNAVAAVVQFNYRDNRAWPGGLVKANGRKKPVFPAFVALAKKPIPPPHRSILR
jgi:hypothetical protein